MLDLRKPGTWYCTIPGTELQHALDTWYRLPHCAASYAGLETRYADYRIVPHRMQVWRQDMSEAQVQNTNISKRLVFKRFFSYFKPYWFLFALGLLALLAVTASRLAGPLILRAIIDKAIPQKDVSLMLQYAFLYFALVIFMGVITYFESMLMVRLGLNVVTNIKSDLFAHMVTLPVAYFDKHQVGELMARVENDTERVKQLFSETAIMLITNIIYFIGMFIVFITIDAKLAGIIFIPIPFLLAAFLLVFDKLRPLYEKARKKYAEVCAVVTEFVQGIEVLQVFKKTEKAVSKLEKVSKEKRDIEIRAGLIEYIFMGGLQFLAGPLFLTLIIKLTAPQIFRGILTVGTLLVFIEYGMRLFEPLFAIGENVRSIQQARVAMERIFSIMSLEPEEAVATPTNKPEFKHAIEFRDVSFAYKEGEPVLDHVSFTVKKGQTIALVGPSGSGKTTTVSLLCRFYPYTSGEILVDGVRLESLDLHEWRKHIGLVLQDIYLFPGTVLENVRVYNDKFTELDVFKALETVHADDFVRRLPHGAYTELAERGGNLSMGEKQLISFARAVVFNADIIIMDEATASVDVVTEKKIQRSMKDLLKGRTAIIVAHRLSSILTADEILFFKNGRIAARGKHHELLAEYSEYEELVRLQFPDLSADAELDEAT